jgi:serine/threonine protein kinase
VDLFIREARNLSKLQHPNIVGVHQIFEDNDTAYMALDLVEGQDLLDIIEDDNQSLSPGQTQGILRQVLDAVRYIHEKNVLHRDISPDNILLSKTGKPVLIDFGAAREEVTRASRALSALMIVKDGYSPQEFYVTGSEHFPSSDLYALGATFYHLIAGEVPPNSQLRLSAIAGGEADPYVPLSGRFPGSDREFLAAIDKALNIFPKDRIQSALDWIMLIDPDKRQAAAMAEAARDQTIELTISRLVSDTNQILLAEDDTVKDEGVALQKTAPEPAKVVEYLSYDPVVDDIGEPEATGQEDLVEDPVADTEFAAPRPSLIRRIFGALGLWRSA